MIDDYYMCNETAPMTSSSASGAAGGNRTGGSTTVGMATEVDGGQVGLQSASNIATRGQAENKKISPSTFPNGFDPRIDLAPIFLTSGTVFTYHQSLLCGPLWPPLALPPLWTGLPHESD